MSYEKEENIKELKEIYKQKRAENIKIVKLILYYLIILNNKPNKKYKLTCKLNENVKCLKALFVLGILRPDKIFFALLYLIF